MRDRALELRPPRHDAWEQRRRWNKRGGAPEKTEEFTWTCSPAEGTKCPFFEEPEQKKGTLTNPTELCVAEEPDAAAHESKEKAEQ